MNAWFQQDEALPEYERNVGNFLNEIFPIRWIGRTAIIKWPTQYLILTHDFSLKAVAYTQRPKNLELL